jgi:predicted metal-dependent phosphoesterase TrpH
MLKVDFHTHTADDPLDEIPYSSTALIDRAAALGFDALAITLHDRQLDIAPLEGYARDRGIVLIPGVERTIEGRHVLLLNFSEGTDDVRTFDDLAALRRRVRGLVIAPHPFFPGRTCLWSRLERYAGLFDAVECNAMFTASLDFNVLAEAWARRRGKPVVGNGDVHRICQLGTTYSLVDAPRGADATTICDAVAAGRVAVVREPLAWRDAASIMSELLGWPLRAGQRTLATPASDSTNTSLPQTA